MRLLKHGLLLFAALGALAVLTVGGASAQESSATDLMSKANDRYERGEYAEAAQQYEALIDRGFSDAGLYFNLGNAYLESGDLGRAILNYLRAREVSPRDPGIRNNLELARSMTLDSIAAERGGLVESVSYFGRQWTTPGELAVAALLLWTASGLSIGALLVWRVFPLRRVARFVTVLMAGATLASLLILVSMVYSNSYDNTGILTAEAVEIVSGPGPQYPEEFNLYSGAQVRVTDSRHGWLRIELPGGELRGWVPSHTIAAVGADVKEGVQ